MLQLQQRVVFHPGLRCFYDTQLRKRMKGAARLLERTFWPEYSFFRAPRSSGRSGEGPPPSSGMSARGGRQRGARVDREVSRAAQGLRVRNAHPFTGFALEALRRSGISLVGSQVVVFEGSIATAIDVLGQDARGAYCCVELKCSSNSRYASSCGPMRGELCGRGDCLDEQHKVQCLVTRLLFEKTYGVQAHAYVLRVNESGATLTRLPRARDAECALRTISRVRE